MRVPQGSLEFHAAASARLGLGPDMSAQRTADMATASFAFKWAVPVLGTATKLSEPQTVLAAPAGAAAAANSAAAARRSRYAAPRGAICALSGPRARGMQSVGGGRRRRPDRVGSPARSTPAGINSRINPATVSFDLAAR